MEKTVKVIIEWPASDEACWDWFEKIRAQAQHPQRQGRIKVSEPTLAEE